MRSSEPGEERSSIFLPPVLRRRCVDIRVEETAARSFSAVVVSRKWSPPRVIQKLVGALPGFRIASGLRRIFGRRYETKVTFDGSVGSPVPTVYIGEHGVPVSSIVAIALQGWQEDFGQDRVWDVMLLGPNVDILVGHKSYEEVQRFANKLAEVTGLPVRESSVVGGSLGTSTYKISDARDFGPPR